MVKKTEELSTEERLSGTIANFIQKNKDLIIGFCILIVIAIIGVAIGVTASNKAKEKAQIRIDALQTRYTEFTQSLDEEEYASLKADLEKEIKGKKYSSVKAAYLLGLAEFEMKDYEGALANFEKSYELNSKIYLSPLALLNAAVCAENLKDTDKALELYTKASEYTESGVAAKAIFNIGRIYFESGKYDLAKSNFQLLADNYPYSEYTKLAQNIITVI